MKTRQIPVCGLLATRGMDATVTKVLAGVFAPRKLLSIIAAGTLLLCTLGLAACDDSPPPPQGVILELINDGGSNDGTYRVRKGTVTGGEVVIPDTHEGLPVTEIGSANDSNSALFAFYNTYITSITIPASVTIIGGAAFYGCTILTGITIPSSVTYIGDYAFNQCNLSSITIVEGVTYIGRDAFGSCRSLTSIAIPASVMYIGIQAFSDCTSLTEITIPDSVTFIGESVFQGSNNLTNITVDANNPNYASDGVILYNKGKTTLLAYPSASGNITISASVTSIGVAAFASCTVTGITISNNVMSIGNSAFQYCRSLTSIMIDSGVTSIGDWAFTACDNLTSVTFATGSAITSFGSNAFPEGSNSYSDNLKTAYLASGAGTYTRDNDGEVWTKQ